MTPQDINILIKIILGVAAVFLLGSLTAIIDYARERWGMPSLNVPALNFRGRTFLGVLLMTVVWVTLLLLLISCSPRIQALHTEGIIIKSEEDRVFVLFEDALGKPGNYSGNWFYVPGVGIVDRERYKILVTLEEIK